jgi:hypothetical protein
VSGTRDVGASFDAIEDILAAAGVDAVLPGSDQSLMRQGASGAFRQALEKMS